MKTGKRFVSIFLVVLMLLTAAPLAGFVGLEIAPRTKALDTSGKCGDNVYWSFKSSTGALTISGSGAMTNYSEGKSPFCYSSDIKSLTISSGVTSIGNYSFEYGWTLTSVTISNSVTSIGTGAFLSCKHLTSISIPNSVTRIGFGAFDYCLSLTRFIISGVNKSYSTDDSGCLYNKNKTSLIQYPAGNTRTKFAIPSSVTSIGNDAFLGCSVLTNVMIPSSVTSIGLWAFGECSSLVSITIPNRVTSIGDSTFSYCSSLSSVTIPNSVISIGDDAFSECHALAEVYYRGSQTQWNNINVGRNNESLFDATIHYGFTVGIDNNSFYHHSSKEKQSGFYNISSYEMGTEYIKKLKSIPNVNKSEIDKEIDSKWGGSCFGLSSAMGLAFMGLLSPSSFIKNSDTFYELGKPCEDFDFLSKINYLHLLQYTPAQDAALISKTYGAGFIGSTINFFTSGVSLPSFMKAVVGSLQSGGVYLIKICIPDYGHGVLLSDCVYNKTSDRYEIKLYDCNSVNSSNPKGKFGYIHVSGDYKKFTIKTNGKTITEKDEINNLHLLDLTKLSKYSFDKNFTSTKTMSFSSRKKQNGEEYTSFTFDADSSFTLENAEGKELTYFDQSFSGNMEIFDLIPVISNEDSTRYRVLINRSDNYSLQLNDRLFDGSFSNDEDYISIIVENADRAFIDSKEAITIDGEDMAFDCFIKCENLEDCSVAFSGNTSSDLLIERKNNQVDVTSAGSISDAKVIHYFDEEKNINSIDETAKGLVIHTNDLITETISSHTHTYTSTITTDPTCTTDGETTYTCSCGDIYTEPIPATGNHADDNNDGKCDTCGEKMTGGKHCKYCGKIHGGAFGWLVKFFHSIFAIFKR